MKSSTELRYTLSMDGDMGWPLGPDQQRLLGELAALVARGGAWRFLHAPVVAANAEHYPDQWEETRAGVARIVGRTLWHAYVGINAVIEDVRQPAKRDLDLLRATHFELAHVDVSSAVFEFSAIGNDDVAGEVTHEVGRAFVGWLARDGHPFRIMDDGLPAPAIGSIATVYLGLGVVAANAAYYDQSAGEVLGQSTHHSHRVVQCGGLAVRDLAFLLAVQATVRDDVLTAFKTLRPTQAECVAAWREVLDDHEVELKQQLGISDGEVGAEAPPARPAVPAEVLTMGAFAETDLHKYNLGRQVFRIAGSYGWLGGGLGLGAGLIVGLIVAFALKPFVAMTTAMVALLLGPLLGTIGGFCYGGARRFFRCVSCGGLVTATDEECSACGGRVAGELANPGDRLAREEELDETELASAKTGACSAGDSPTSSVSATD